MFVCRKLLFTTVLLQQLVSGTWITWITDASSSVHADCVFHVAPEHADPGLPRTSFTSQCQDVRRRLTRTGHGAVGHDRMETIETVSPNLSKNGDGKLSLWGPMFLEAPL